MRMKFKVISPKTLAKLVAPLDKLGARHCTLRFSRHRFYLVVKDAADATQVWSHAPADLLFEEMLLESSHPTSEIALSVPTALLHRAVKSMATAHAVTVKLARNPTPVLAMTMVAESKAGARPVVVHHDVPIRVLKRSAIDELREPRMPWSDVYVALPPLATLRAMIDRIKAMGATHLTLASRHGLGELRIRAETPNVQFETVIGRLEHARVVDERGQDAGPAPLATALRADQLAEVTVATADFSRVMQCHVAHPTQVVLAIHHQVCAVVYAHLDAPDSPPDDVGRGGHAAPNQSESVLTYYVPARIL
ncbi:hypothetical protein AMAG_11833 [Allomyces macrogynus ATCC 38327]|uniref:Checkpoint protein n=1 Tax=Allomyces macrogynus (strain ATCC 38327) TaxID=578462 RepID=A0A0L0SXZ3_ALLM3|nr:hypothetical protein AMAG_11833 [Allomyces macrogynus ATCC 38327]|eukprot:KNE67366.1 hypothetical protein AMAG_11833 [Allomyces macrogynus ATCC 38327]